MVLCLLSGCQPYIDQVDESAGFRAQFVDFGVRRDLKLVDARGDSESLLLVFNQPISQLSQSGEVAPFSLKFYPRIPVKSVVREGVAGVRVRFGEPLPPAQSYSAEVSKGWRALSGATFLKSKKVSWDTQRPELLNVQAADGDQQWSPGKSVSLQFNMAVEPESVRDRVVIAPVTGKRPLSVDAWSLAGDPENPKNLVLKLDDKLARARYRLSLREGYYPARGRLGGAAAEGLEFGPRLPFHLARAGPLTQTAGKPLKFTFDSPVDPVELRRHLSELDWEKVRLESIDHKTFLLYGLDPVAQQISITRGLLSEGGRLLAPPFRLYIRPGNGAEPPAPLKLEHLTLPAGTTLLNFPVEKESEVATWTLKEGELVRLFCGSSVALKKLYAGLEKAKPVYQVKLEKATPRMRFLTNKEPWLKKSSHGLFLVRVRKKGRADRRFLVLRSSLRPVVVSINQNVYASSAPLRTLAVLYSREGKKLQQKLTDEKGEVAFDATSVEHPALLLVRRGDQLQVTNVVDRPLESPSVSGGVVWVDNSSVGPGEAVDFFGAWWSSEPLPSVMVRDRQGRAIDLQPSLQADGMMFRGLFTAPREVGRYSLTLGSDPQRAPSAFFDVTDLTPEASPSSLSLEKREGGGYQGQYRWEGAGGSQVALRVRVVATLNQVDGWSLQQPEVPRWSPVDVSLTREIGGARFEIEHVPELEVPHRLEAELYDRREPSRVFRRATVELVPQKVKLQHAIGRLGSQGEQILTFQFLFGEPLEQGQGLECELQLRRGKQWHTLSKGPAEPSESGEGSYRWSTGLASEGRVRLVLTQTGAGSPEELAVWESATTSVRSRWASLSVSSDRVQPGEKIAMSWPGPERKGQVWMGFLVGEKMLPMPARTLQADGSLGNVQVPSLSPGVVDFMLWAALSAPDGSVKYRRVRLQALDEQIVEPLAQTVDGREDFQVCKAGEELELQFAQAGGRKLLCWWEPEVDEPAHNQVSPWRRLLGRSQSLQPLHHDDGRVWVTGPETLDKASTTIVAPSVPGRYTLRLLSEVDHALSYARRGVEVKPGAHWETLAPEFVRPGDKFTAGIRFWSDPAALAASGATISVELDSALVPLTYYATAALVDPGSFKDMRFFYQAPDSFTTHAGDGFYLHWELGVEGKAWPIGTTVGLRPNPAKAKKYRSRLLSPHSALKFNLTGKNDWRLDLHYRDEQPDARLQTSLKVRMGEQPDQDVKLTEDRQMVKLFQSGKGEITVQNKGGSPIEVDIYQLTPEKVTSMATSVYLLTARETPDGRVLDEHDSVPVGQPFQEVYALVVPEALSETWLVVPLPGGVKVTNCSLRKYGSTHPLNWNIEDGYLLADVPALERGESSIVLTLVPEVSGDFSWPSPTINSLDGSMSAGAPASRLVVQ